MTNPLLATQPEGPTTDSGQTAGTMNGTNNGANTSGSPAEKNPYLRNVVSPAVPKPTGLRVDVFHYKQEPLVPNVEEAEKYKNDKLAACKHVIESQPKTLQASIQLFAKKMVSGTNDLHEVEERLRPFNEWDQKKDPANPCYLPQNFRFKSKLNFTSNDALGDAEAEALISEMTEATLNFKKIASDLTQKGHKLDTKLMQQKRLETFASSAIKLIDPFVEYAKLTGPGKAGSRDNNTLAGVFLLKYTGEHLHDDYLLYLRTTKDELQNKILQTITMDSDTHASLLNPNFTKDEYAIYDTVVGHHLSNFFVAVTLGLQKYLDDERTKRMIATKMKAYTLKKDIREATDATAETIADEETLTPKNLTKLIDDRIKVSKNLKGGRQAQSAKPTGSTKTGPSSKVGRQTPSNIKRNRDAETKDNTPPAKRAKTKKNKQVTLKKQQTDKLKKKKRVTFEKQHNERSKNQSKNLQKRKETHGGSRKDAQKRSSATKKR